MKTLCRAASFTLAALLLPAFTQAQNKDLRQSLFVTLATESYYSSYPHPAQGIGVGLGYRYQFRPWIGVKVQAADYASSQPALSEVAAYGSEEFDLLATGGHRWKKIEVLAEIGPGWFASRIEDSSTTQVYRPVRIFPQLVVGGTGDLHLTKRWGLNYEVRDNVTFIGQYRSQLFPQFPSPAVTVHNFDARFGVGYHF